MAQKDQLIKEKLNYSGFFNFKGAYSFAHSWLYDEKFDIVEDKYSEKVSGNARDINFTWRVSKRLSEYFKTEYEMKFTIKNLTEVEVEIDGERKKMNKGDIEVETKASLVKDPDSKWEGSPFLAFLRDVYNTYVIPSRIFNMENIVTSNVMKFNEQMKAYLELSGRRGGTVENA